MKTRITTKNVGVLVEEFNSTKETILKIEKVMKSTVDEIVKENRVMEPAEMKKLGMYQIPVKKQLETYTIGLPSYLRSVGRQDEASKPPVEFLDRVRSVLQQAQELDADFDWCMGQIRIKVSINNMLLGCFDSLDLMGDVPSVPSDDVEAAGPAASEPPAPASPAGTESTADDHPAQTTGAV